MNKKRYTWKKRGVGKVDHLGMQYQKSFNNLLIDNNISVYWNYRAFEEFLAFTAENTNLQKLKNLRPKHLDQYLVELELDKYHSRKAHNIRTSVYYYMNLVEHKYTMEWLKEIVFYCPYCNAELECDEKTKDSNSSNYIHRCKNYPKCDTYVETDRYTLMPLGLPRSKEIRKQRLKLNRMINYICENHPTKRKNAAKNASYSWMSEVLSIPKDEMSIAYLESDECQIIVNKLRNTYYKLKDRKKY